MLSQTYKSYTYWRSRILKMHGRSPADVYLEYEQVQQGQEEGVTEFMDRLYVLLTAPAAKIS